MVLDTKQTTVAYRCPHCGAGVLSMVNVFSLGADMVKLKCDCHKSEMTIVKQNDGKIRLTVPCILCPKPHNFVVSPSIFFGKDQFFLQCHYSDMNIGFIGDENYVKAELARTELELLDLMEKSGITDFSAIHGDVENESEQLTDPEMQQNVLFVLSELEAEGKIYCHCEHSDKVDEEKFELEIKNGGVLVTCRDCKAEKLIPTDNSLEAHAFIDSDVLRLE